MLNDQLLNYIKQSKESGLDDEQIRQVLIQAGWSTSDIEEAMSQPATSNQSSVSSGEKKLSFQLSKSLIIILIVAFVAATGYFASAYYLTLWPFEAEVVTTATLTPSPSSVVKKYTPEDLGFIITLPSGWNYEAINSSEPDIKATFKYASSDAKQSFVISVFSDKDPEKMTLAQWSKQDATNYNSQAKQDETFAKIGKNSGSIYSGEVDGRTYKRMYLIRGVLKEIYRITVEIDKNNSWMSEFDQIIETFNFFEPKTDTSITYKNLQFSFEITHPSTWRAREESDSVRLRNYYTPILDLPIDPVDITINYMKDKNPNQLPIQEWLKVGSNNIFISYEKSRQNVSLGDEAIRSVRDTYSKTPGKSTISYLIKKGKDIVQATYTATDNTNYVKNPDQIIETLRFVQPRPSLPTTPQVTPSTTNNTSAQMTYANEKYGYSFVYPSQYTTYTEPENIIFSSANLVIVAGPNNTYPYFRQPGVIFVSKVGASSKISKLTAENLKNTFSVLSSPINKETPLVINGNEAILIDHGTEATSGGIELFVRGKENIFSVSLGKIYSSNDFSVFTNLYKSFKILEQ